MTVRPLRPGERHLVEGVFERLSPRSRFLRFLSPMPRLPARLLDRLAGVDGTDHVALVALEGDEPVGVARFVRDAEDPTRAELAIAVADAHQRRGVGRRLLCALLAAASERGIRELTFETLPENRAARALFRAFGARPVTAGGLIAGTLPTPVPAPGPCGSSSRTRSAPLRLRLGTHP